MKLDRPHHLPTYMNLDEKGFATRYVVLSGCAVCLMIRIRPRQNQKILYDVFLMCRPNYHKACYRPRGSSFPLSRKRLASITSISTVIDLHRAGFVERTVTVAQPSVRFIGSFKLYQSPLGTNVLFLSSDIKLLCLLRCFTTRNRLG